MRDGDFRIRGKEISRVEGLSDAVFGFAITLLIVSLEVPKTAAEVLHGMRGFFAFAMTFTILFMLWRRQFIYFRRYGLEDNVTVGLTAVLLFTVLFFVYPLKFIFGTMVERLLTAAGFPDVSASAPVHFGDVALLMIPYGLGWCSVFGVFALLYRHGHRLREQLQLTPVEEFDTVEAIWGSPTASVAGLLIAVVYTLVNLLPAHRNALELASTFGFAVVFGIAIRRRKTRKRRRGAVLATMSVVTES